MFSSISCLVGLGALCQVVRRGPQLKIGLGPPEQLNPTMMIAREDKKSHWSNAVLSFLHCWNDRITTRNRNQDACIGNFKFHPKEDAKVSTSLWLTSKHQDGALTLLPERSWQGLSQNAFLLNQTVGQLVQHRPQMVRESDQFIMSLYHIKKAQSLQFKWKIQGDDLKTLHLSVQCFSLSVGLLKCFNSAYFLWLCHQHQMRETSVILEA